MSHSRTDIRSENILSVIEALTREPYMTRDALAQYCHLSLTTVGKIINRLHDYGVLSQKQIQSVKNGRTLSAFAISDSIAMATFRIGEYHMTMELLDLRFRPLRRVHQAVLPDRDPGESLLSFLLLCRRELEASRKHILLCGLLSENTRMDSDMISQTMHTYLKLPVTIGDSTVHAIARAAAHEGIAADDRCVAVISNDASCSGFMIYHGILRQGAVSPIRQERYDRSCFAEEMLHAIQILTAFIIPDTLLICSLQDTEDLQANLETALKASAMRDRPTVAIRNTDRMLSLGMAIHMRHTWLEEMHRETQRLRPTASPH